MSNQPNLSENKPGKENLQVVLAIQKNDIIKKLHNNKNYDSDLAPSEVSPALLCSNNIVIGDTSLGGKKTELDYPNLKLLLKDLAKQIIKQTYEEIRSSGSNLH